MGRNLPGLCAALAVLASSPDPITTPAARAQVELPDGFSLVELASLPNPVGFAFLPDGRVLIIENKQDPPNENEGRVYLYAGGTLTSSPVLVIPDVNAAGNERGLLGVAVDPGWPTRPYAYFQYTHTDGSGHVRMYEAQGDLADPVSPNLSFTNPYDVLADLPDVTEWHNGGTLRFGSDGKLYVSQGDDATWMCTDHQDPSRWYGVILRLDVSALPGPGPGPPAKSLLVPAGNPYPGPDDNARLTFAIGFRNPFRFNIDPVTGVIYAGDVGEDGYEELDEAGGGENFGWPMREGAHAYPPGLPCGLSDGIDPIAEIAHAGTAPFSIISGPRYRPTGGVFDLDPEYDGDVFYAEFYSGVIRRITYQPVPGSWAPAPAVPGQPGALDWARGVTFVSDIQVGPDGALYLTRLRGPSTSFARISGPPSVDVSEPSPPSPPPLVVRLTHNPVSAGEALTLTVSLAEESEVALMLFDTAGRRVDSSAPERRPAGSHEIRWESGTARSSIPAGTYFLRVLTPGRSATSRVVVMH